MATPNELLLATQQKNLATLQDDLVKVQNDPEKVAAINQQIARLEDGIIDTSSRVAAENSITRTIIQSDGTKETYDANGVLIKSEPPPNSSNQKTVNTNQDTNGENPPPLKNPPATGATNETNTENESTAETERLLRQNAAVKTVSKVVSNPTAVAANDWRVRLSLAPSANYLYMDPVITGIDKSTHILAPLRATSGVLFPYMPTISVAYRANYESSEVTHSNYRLQFYKGSSVDDIQITAEFTAQDSTEAKYLLAVIHFFRSVTKMFYGQDSNPRGGTPPPLCYLSGLGAYQFNKHPIVISSFQYTLPTDVDYIRTEATTDWAGSGMSTAESTSGKKAPNIFQQIRLKMAGARPGADPPRPTFKNLSSISEENSYVPTKMQITLGAHVIVTRGDVSKEFSLENYASGKLIKKGFW